LRVIAVGSGQALGDGEAVPVGLERLFELALRPKHVADLDVGDRQVVLPLHIAATGGDEAWLKTSGSSGKTLHLKARQIRRRMAEGSD
jgi:hypothetical protein